MKVDEALHSRAAENAGGTVVSCGFSRGYELRAHGANRERGGRLFVAQSDHGFYFCRAARRKVAREDGGGHEK
jgi:hypothetical protein